MCNSGRGVATEFCAKRLFSFFFFFFLSKPRISLCRLLPASTTPRSRRPSLTLWSSSLVHGPLMSSGLRTFCHLCWHCTSVRFWQVRAQRGSQSRLCFAKINKGIKRNSDFEANLSTELTLQFELLLLTDSKLAISFQSSDP